MNINEIIDQMESGLEVALPGPWVFHPDTMRAIIDAYRQLEARAVKAERERDEAIRALSEQARLRGEAEGRLEASEMAGVVDGWKARVERAEAKVERLMEALKPFAKAPCTGPNAFNRAALSDVDFRYARTVYADAMEATNE